MAVNNSHEMTREGYDNLNAELEQLITVTRKENAERLKEAIALGDISENAEYDAAKNAQAETEEGDDSVQTGRTVTVRDLVLGITATYKIVGTTEADPLNGKLSNASLVGEHLIGLKAGDKTEFAVPDGIAKYEVLEVRR